jgi:hypothetical protein
MAKVIVKKLKANPKRLGKTGVSEKRVRTSAGRLKTLRTLDVASRTFGADLQYVFAKNVAEARRDNKRVIGTADIAVPKR